MSAYIEELKDSIIDSNVTFDNGFKDMRELVTVRKANLKTTTMIWITLRPVIDCGFTLYNKKALIFKILN